MDTSFQEQGGYETTDFQERPAIKQSLRTITAKQLTQIDNGLLDGVEISSITTTGIVRDVLKNNTGVSFKLFDTTGIINCTFWPNPNTANSNVDEYMRNVVENKMIRVIGTYRKFNDMHGLVCKCIKEADGNTLIYSLTSAAYEKTRNNRIDHSSNNENNISNSNANKQEMVLSVIKENQTNEGVHIDTLCAMLKTEMPEKDVRRFVQDLCNNCKVYKEGGEKYKIMES